MNWVEHVVKDYLVSPELSPSDLELGGGQPGFDTRLERARLRARAGYWICVVMLIALFVVVLIVSWQSFDKLVALGATGMAAASGIFGMGAGTCVRLMMRWANENSRAEILLVLLHDLRKNDPAEFNRIVSLLASQWYGLAPTTRKAAPSSPTAT